MDYTNLYYESPMPARIFDATAADYIGCIVYHEYYLDGRNYEIKLIKETLTKAVEYGIDIDEAIYEYPTDTYDLNDFLLNGRKINAQLSRITTIK